MADTEFRRKLLSLSINTGSNKGRSNTTPVLRDDAPGVSGRRTEHWDGRVDAVCTNPTITVNPNLKGSLHGRQD
jgi:hypothetical protein